MQLLIKITGLMLILLTTTLIGFLKAQKLVVREKRLFEIYLCICDLKERIRLDGGEIERLLKQSFANKQYVRLDVDNNRAELNGMNNEEQKLLNEYLSNIGMSDIKAECDRAELYSSMFLKLHSEAKKQSDDLCKLYRTLGVMSGIFICIFLV